MNFEYDPNKDRLNRERHGVDFAEAQELWRNPHVVLPARRVRGEERRMIVWTIEGKVFVAIFTVGSGWIRLISCHRADARWEKIYEKYLAEERPH